LWDQLLIIVKIFGHEVEEKVSLEQHIKRKFTVNASWNSEIQENTRSCSGGLITGNFYSTLVGKCFEMAICNTEEYCAYNDEDKCHMSDRCPFKRWKLAQHLMYIPEVHDKNCLIYLFRSSNTCLYNTLTTKKCNVQLGVFCNSVSCSACICSSSCLITALSGSAVCALPCTTCKTFCKPNTTRSHSC